MHIIIKIIEIMPVVIASGNIGRFSSGSALQQKRVFIQMYSRRMIYSGCSSRANRVNSA